MLIRQLNFGVTAQKFASSGSTFVFHGAADFTSLLVDSTHSQTFSFISDNAAASPQTPTEMCWGSEEKGEFLKRGKTSSPGHSTTLQHPQCPWG